jgi:hypothetical protein
MSNTSDLISEARSEAAHEHVRLDTDRNSVPNLWDALRNRAMRIELAKGDSAGCSEFHGTVLDYMVDARPVIFAPRGSTRVAF